MSWAPRVVAFAVLLLLPAPVVIVAASSFSGSGYLTFPPGHFTWRLYGGFLGSPDWLRALGVSLLLALLAAGLSAALGGSVAWSAMRGARRWRGWLDFMAMLPIVFPQAALGVVMLAIVAALNGVGSFAGVLFAHVVVTLPYAYRPLLAGLERLDRDLEDAAMNLGATPAMVLRRVTLPMLLPSVATALLFCFIISFDETTVTLFLVGPDFTTLPIRIFDAIENNADPVVAAVSTALVAATGALVLLLGRLNPGALHGS